MSSVFVIRPTQEGAGVKVQLVRNIHSWHKVANILYIDNPVRKLFKSGLLHTKVRCQVGTGFSHTNSSEGYPTTDAMVAEHLAEALKYSAFCCNMFDFHQTVHNSPSFLHPGVRSKKKPVLCFWRVLWWPLCLGFGCEFIRQTLNYEFHSGSNLVR